MKFRNLNFELKKSIDNAWAKKEGNGEEPKRAIVIDDDHSTLRLVSKQIKEYGFNSVESYTAEFMALDQITQDLPDLLIIDLFLLGSSGLKVIEVLNTLTTHEIPILLISNYKKSEDEITDRFGDQNIKFLKKPLFKEELHKKVDELLMTHQVRVAA